MSDEILKLVEELAEGMDGERFYIALVGAMEAMKLLEGKPEFDYLYRHFDHRTWFEDFEPPSEGFPYDPFTAQNVSRYIAADHLSGLPDSVVVDQDVRQHIDIVSIEDNDTVVLTRVTGKIGADGDSPDDPLVDAGSFADECRDYIGRVFGGREVRWRGDSMSVLIIGPKEAKIRRAMGITGSSPHE